MHGARPHQRREVPAHAAADTAFLDALLDRLAGFTALRLP
jgi:hypothetical protein